MLGGLLFALEANNIRRLSLARRGWRDIGGSFGGNLDEAEIRFFEKWGKAGAGGEPATGATRIARAAYCRRRAAPMPTSRSSGSFPEPER